MKTKHLILDFNRVLLNLNDIEYKILKEVTNFKIRKFSKKFYYDNMEYLSLTQKLEIVEPDDLKHISLIEEYIKLQDEYLWSLEYDKPKIKVLEQLRSEYGLSFGIATNVSHGLAMGLVKHLLTEAYIGMVTSAETSLNPLPHPNMYLKHFYLRNVLPKECLVISNDIKNLKIARNCGADTLYLPNEKYFNFEHISNNLPKRDESNRIKNREFGL